MKITFTIDIDDMELLNFRDGLKKDIIDNIYPTFLGTVRNEITASKSLGRKPFHELRGEFENMANRYCDRFDISLETLRSPTRQRG